MFNFFVAWLLPLPFFTFIDKVFQDLVSIKYFIYWKIMNISPGLSVAFKILIHAYLL